MCINALYARHTSLFPVKAHPRKILVSFFPIKRILFVRVLVLFFLVYFFPIHGEPEHTDFLIIILLYFFFFLNWVIRIILGFFFPLNDITKNFVKESQTNCCQKTLFIEKSGFHKAVSVGVAVKSKPSGKRIFLRRFFSAAEKTHALVKKNYLRTRGANIARRKRRHISGPSHACRAALTRDLVPPAPVGGSRQSPSQLPRQLHPGRSSEGEEDGGAAEVECGHPGGAPTPRFLGKASVHACGDPKQLMGEAGPPSPPAWQAALLPSGSSSKAGRLASTPRPRECSGLPGKGGPGVGCEASPECLGWGLTSISRPRQLRKNKRGERAKQSPKYVKIAHILQLFSFSPVLNLPLLTILPSSHSLSSELLGGVFKRVHNIRNPLA